MFYTRKTGSERIISEEMLSSYDGRVKKSRKNISQDQQLHSDTLSTGDTALIRGPLFS